MCKVWTKDLLAQWHYEKKGLCKVATKCNPNFGNALNQRAFYPRTNQGPYPRLAGNQIIGRNNHFILIKTSRAKIK